jgi:hypothetical protein
MYWPSWQSSRIENDLDFYATGIRLAPSPLSLKEPLLDRIYAIEDRVWKGGRLDYPRWRRHDTAIRQLLKQGLDHETDCLIERELNRIECQIDEKIGPEESGVETNTVVHTEHERQEDNQTDPECSRLLDMGRETCPRKSAPTESWTSLPCLFNGLQCGGRGNAA